MDDTEKLRQYRHWLDMIDGIIQYDATHGKPSPQWVWNERKRLLNQLLALQLLTFHHNHGE